MDNILIIKAPFFSSEKIKEFYEELGKLQIVSERANNNFTVYTESIGSELEERANENWEESEDELEATLKEIANRYKAFSEEINIVLAKIRKEMKRFEY